MARSERVESLRGPPQAGPPLHEPAHPFTSRPTPPRAGPPLHGRGPRLRRTAVFVAAAAAAALVLVCRPRCPPAHLPPPFTHTPCPRAQAVLHWQSLSLRLAGGLRVRPGCALDVGMDSEGPLGGPLAPSGYSLNALNGPHSSRTDSGRPPPHTQTMATSDRRANAPIRTVRLHPISAIVAAHGNVGRRRRSRPSIARPRAREETAQGTFASRHVNKRSQGLRSRITSHRSRPIAPQGPPAPWPLRAPNS